MFTFIVTDKVGSLPVQDFACHAVEFNSENSRGHCECLSIELLMGVFSEKRREEVRVKAGRQLKIGSAVPGKAK